MSNRVQSLFTDTRHHFRVHDNRRLLWKVKQGVQRGRAKIVNLSATGMLMETNGTFVPPKDGCIFAFDTNLGPKNYIPQNGQLVWSKKSSRFKNRYQCGIQFVEPSEYVQTKLRQRVQKGILSITKTRQATHALSVLLTAAIVGLTGYTIWISQDVYQGFATSTDRLLDVSEKQSTLTRNYASLYNDSQSQLASVTEELNSTRQLYQESTAQLTTVTQELSETKMILAQTEAMLVEAKTGSERIQSGLETVIADNEAQFAQTKAAFENEIALLQNKNFALEREMSTLQEQLSFYEGNVKNIDEGYVLVNIYRERMKAVKGKIKIFKREVRDLRRKAQNERDRIQLALGNNGYFMRDGAAVEVDMEKYLAAKTAPVVVRQTEEGLPPKVEISVTNFE